MKTRGAVQMEAATWHVPGSGLAIGCLAVSFLGLGCAQLLDIPEEPRVRAEPDALQMQAESSASPASAGRQGLPGFPGGLSQGGSPNSSTAPPTEQAVAEPSRPLDTSEDSSGLSVSPPYDAGLGEATFDASVPDAGLPEPGDAEVPPVVPPAEECPPGALFGPDEQCYSVLGAELAWADARQGCQALGGGWDLASIRSEAVDQFTQTLSDEELWLGASDLQQEGTWRWVDDGTVFWQGDAEEGVVVDDQYVRWNASEPNGGGNSGCMRSVPAQQGIWADLECEFERLALCRGPRETQ